MVTKNFRFILGNLSYKPKVHGVESQQTQFSSSENSRINSENVIMSKVDNRLTVTECKDRLKNGEQISL